MCNLVELQAPICKASQISKQLWNWTFSLKIVHCSFKHNNTCIAVQFYCSVAVAAVLVEEDKWLKLVKLVVNSPLLNRIPNSPTAPQSSHLVYVQFCTKVKNSAPNCTNLYQTAQFCTKLHSSAPNWTNLYQTAHICTRVCKVVHQTLQ